MCLVHGVALFGAVALLEGECHCGHGIKIYLLSFNFATKLIFRITEDRGGDSVSKTLIMVEDQSLDS